MNYKMMLSALVWVVAGSSWASETAFQAQLRQGRQAIRQNAGVGFTWNATINENSPWPAIMSAGGAHIVWPKIVIGNTHYPVVSLCHAKYMLPEPVLQPIHGPWRMWCYNDPSRSSNCGPDGLRATYLSTPVRNHPLSYSIEVRNHDRSDGQGASRVLFRKQFDIPACQ